MLRYFYPNNSLKHSLLKIQKTPETQGFWVILRLDTTLSYDNKSIFRLYYSMIVATNAIGKKEAIKRVEELTEIDKYKEILESMEEVRKNSNPTDLKFPDQEKK